MKRFRGQTAVVTGAGRGIGKEIALELDDSGASVLGCGRGKRPDDLPDAIAWTRADVSDPLSVRALLVTAQQMPGQLSILVNNAGVQIEKNIVQTTDQEWEDLIGSNCRGVFNTCRAFIPAMEQLGAGSIVNVGSISANSADPNLALYNASKGFVHSLTRAIAVDHGPAIRCNAVCPGWIMTEMADAAFAMASDPQAAKRDAVTRHPSGRLGRPEDIARAVAWIASDDAEFMTGQCMTVDGGLTSASPIRPGAL